VQYVRKYLAPKDNFWLMHRPPRASLADSLFGQSSAFCSQAFSTVDHF
jgi:hypothetical protein